MRKFSYSLIALMVVAGAVAIASSASIEITKLDPVGNGYVCHTLSTGQVPVGSTVHAVMETPQGPQTVDVAPVNPGTGTAMVIFPVHFSGNHVDLRGPGGQLLATAYIGDHEGHAEFD